MNAILLLISLMGGWNPFETTTKNTENDILGI